VKKEMMADGALGILDEDEELSLLETLDHVLDRGLVIAGEVTIAVADIDLIYVGLNLLLGSVESVNRVLGTRERRVELLSAGARRGVETRAVVETDAAAGGPTAEG
jgi:hypothetical protein